MAARRPEVEQRQVGDHGADRQQTSLARATSLAATDSNSGHSSASGAISLTAWNPG